jgi:sugar phosphate isomerase/epimerase
MKQLLLVAALAAGSFIFNSTADAADKLDYAAMDKLGWKLSIQAYTFGRNGVTLFDTLDIMNAMGVRYVELFPGQKLSKDSKASVGPGLSAQDMEMLQKKLKETNIQAVCFGVTGIPRDEKGARKLFDWAKKLGMLNLVTEEKEDAFPALGKLADEYQINVSLHNHPKNSYYWNPDTVLKGVEGQSKRIGSCADTGHWYRSDLMPIDCLKKLEGHITSLHFKDLGKNKSDVPWGTGVCDAKGMLTELKRQGFKGVFSAEYEAGSGQQLIDNVAKSVEWFSATSTELAK